MHMQVLQMTTKENQHFEEKKKYHLPDIDFT